MTRLVRMLLVIVLATAGLTVAAAKSSAASTSIAIDGASSGLRFGGVGGAATTRAKPLS